jgi:hypothetical protein
MKMFCPKCGKDEQAAEAYCRNCGVWLPDLNKPAKSSFGGDTPVQNVNSTIIFNIISALFAAFVIFAIYSVAFGSSNLSAYHATLLFIAGSFATCIFGWQITSVFISLKLRRRISRRKIAFQQSSNLNEASPQNILPAADYSSIAQPFGVTENTTVLLEQTAAKQTNRFD